MAARAPERSCRTCRAPMQVLVCPPACLHQPPCEVSLCMARCQTIWWRGGCACEAVRENPPRAYLTAWPASEAPPAPAAVLGAEEAETAPSSAERQGVKVTRPGSNRAGRRSSLDPDRRVRQPAGQ